MNGKKILTKNEMFELTAHEIKNNYSLQYSLFDSSRWDMEFLGVYIDHSFITTTAITGLKETAPEEIKAVKVQCYTEDTRLQGIIDIKTAIYTENRKVNLKWAVCQPTAKYQREYEQEGIKFIDYSEYFIHG